MFDARIAERLSLSFFQMQLNPIILLIGTRPEAIKMAPVVRALSKSERFRPVLVSSGQHTNLLASALGDFGLTPDFDLGVMTDAQTPIDILGRIVESLPSVIRTVNPLAVLVQGDTTTALAGSLVAYYHRIPLGHVEAGLRSYDLEQPFPEEGNRQVIDRLSRWCFAPTLTAAENLYGEKIPRDRVFVTGNTGIDALLQILPESTMVPSDTPYVLVTLHRRESFGLPLRDIVGGLIDFLRATPDARAVWPVHPNPAVQAVVHDLAVVRDRVSILPPQNYSDFAQLMARCCTILSDSGGVQEEAPSLGKMVLIVRETTERPEAVDAGLNRLIGRDRKRVKSELVRAWAELPYTVPTRASNPFGDGHAAGRIVDSLRSSLLASKWQR